MKPKEHMLDAAVRAPDYMVLYGSQLYGTSTPESDRDERGFVVPPFEYLAGLCRFDQKTEAVPDRVVWSLSKFVSMLMRGDPQAFEMLFAPDDKVLACTDIGSLLRGSVDMFACRRFYGRIMGYAESEWRKVRGVELKPAKRTPTEDGVIEDIRRVFRPDKYGMDEVVRLLFLNHAREEVSARRKLGAKRKVQVERHGYCTSSASHSVRLLGELVEMLDTGRLTFPRPNADRLLAIKKGEVPYGEVEAEFDDAKSDARAAAERTSLPENPSVAGIEGMYHAAVAGRLLTDARARGYAGSITTGTRPLACRLGSSEGRTRSTMH